MVKLNGLVNSDTPLLVVFYAAWCPHCQRMLPVVGQVEESEKERLKVERYDIDAPKTKRC